MNRGRRLSFIHVSTWPVRWGGVSSPARMPSESTGIQFPAHVCCPGESHACGERWDRLSQVRGGRECGTVGGGWGCGEQLFPERRGPFMLLQYPGRGRAIKGKAGSAPHLNLHM